MSHRSGSAEPDSHRGTYSGRGQYGQPESGRGTLNQPESGRGTLNQPESGRGTFGQADHDWTGRRDSVTRRPGLAPGSLARARSATPSHAGRGTANLDTPSGRRGTYSQDREGRATIRSATLPTSQAGVAHTATLPTSLAKRAKVITDVNPYVQFPSLRRGFTLNGEPIPGVEERDQIAIIKVKEDSSAYFFWAFFIFLAVLAIFNLILTLTVIKVLRIGSRGMEGMEFLPKHNAIKFYGNTDLGNVYKEDGVISGYSGEDLELVGMDAPISLVAMAGQQNPPTLKVSAESISLTGVHDFSLIDPATEEVIFSTSDPQMELPDGVNVLETLQAEVSHISSPIDEPLLIRSDSWLHLEGAEGLEVEGSKIDMVASGDIKLTSQNGSVTLDGGIKLDTVMLPHGGGGYEGEIGQFKLCVCMPGGQLFKVKIPDDNKDRSEHFKVGCHSVDLASSNPCGDKLH